VVARWFPISARGPAQGIVITSALVGGAVSPVVAEYLIQGLGWRGAFFVLGIPGVLWAVAFYRWFRDDPAEHPGVNEAERQYIAAGTSERDAAERHPPIPWKQVTSANIWLLGGVITCGAFTTYMFFSWYPTYLQDGRGVSPVLSGWLASLVLTGGAVGSILGGYLSDGLVRRTGDRRWTRRGIGCASLTSAGLAMVASIYCDSPWLAAGCTTWACLAVHLQLAAWWGVVTEISGKHLGALFGLMNSMGVPGAVGSQLFLGRFVDWLGGYGFAGRAQWDPSFYLYGAVLVVGAGCWLFIDAAKSIGERPQS
jgi:sugar phosphate permease